MLIFLAIFAAAALGGIIFLFISPKSSRLQKKAALGALILSGLTLLVCGVIVVLNITGKDKDPYAFPLAIEDAQPVSRTNFFELIVFLVLLIVIFGFIIFVSIREKRKNR